MESAEGKVEGSLKDNNRTVSTEHVKDDASKMIKENAIEDVIKDVIKETLQDLYSKGKAVAETASPEETFRLGELLGAMCRPGELYALTGDLGVGKTVFTQGFAGGLGIEETVNSPTFTILQIYEGGRLPFFHFDVYRIGDVEEMDEIGYEDYFYGDGVCLVEWANLIREILPGNYWEITIRKDLSRGTDFRLITVEEKRGRQ